MNYDYQKECYDANPHCKLHYSHGIPRIESNLYYLHYEENLIIEYMRKGEVSKRIEGNIYTIGEGDLIITVPSELHVPIKTEECYVERLSLHVSESLLCAFGGDRTIFYDTIVGKQKGVGNLIVAEVVKEQGMDILLNQCLEYAKEGTPEAQVLMNCKVIELLAKLVNLAQTGNRDDTAVPSSNKNVNEMIDYINRHYTENVALDILAARFHFSKYYISHLFRDYVGVSPYEYLITRRLYLFNDLVRQKQPIREACFAVGFNNYSNFFRLYKKYFGITPQQFKLSIND